MKRYEDPTITIALFNVANEDGEQPTPSNIEQTLGQDFAVGSAANKAAQSLTGNGVSLSNISGASWSTIAGN